MRRNLGAVAFAALMVVAAPAWAQDAPAGNAETGKKLFLADGCYECHGRVGQGGAFNGPAPILAQTQLPFDAFKQQLREPSADMPAYADTVLPDGGVADIYAFLRALPGPKPVKDIAILNH
ncbi:MAG TPA: c-type cytochrome [Stellaceae bacterium]|nr:c-type cytochrome [Stellaceae bacterium]